MFSGKTPKTYHWNKHNLWEIPKGKSLVLLEDYRRLEDQNRSLVECVNFLKRVASYNPDYVSENQFKWVIRKAQELQKHINEGEKE